MENIFTHWESVINFTRNDIVFEHHNKKYGAYTIRKYYPERLRNAFLYTLSGMTLLFAVPLLLQKSNQIKISVPKNDLVIFVNPIMPREEILIPTAPPPARKVIQDAVKFIPPTVVDNNVLAEPIRTQAQISMAGTGISPQSGENGIEIIPDIPEAIDDTTPRILVSEMPTFIGGEAKLFEFLQKNLDYPYGAKGVDRQGTVYVSFVINKYGKVKDVRVIRGIGAGCDEEAVRVVSIMPDWNAGKQNGNPVAVQFKLPITFKLIK